MCRFSESSRCTTERRWGKGNNFVPKSGVTVPDGGPSPNFVQESAEIWHQSYLAKALLQLKETEFAKLRFSDSSYKPYEYEKWIRGFTRVMESTHPELGSYWTRVLTAAEKV